MRFEVASPDNGSIDRSLFDLPNRIDPLRQRIETHVDLQWRGLEVMEQRLQLYRDKKPYRMERATVPEQKSQK